MFNGMMLGFQMLLRDQPTIIMGGEEEERALEPNPLEQFCPMKCSRLKLKLIVVIKFKCFWYTNHHHRRRRRRRTGEGSLISIPAFSPILSNEFSLVN